MINMSQCEICIAWEGVSDESCTAANPDGFNCVRFGN